MMNADFQNAFDQILHQKLLLTFWVKCGEEDWYVMNRELA